MDWCSASVLLIAFFVFQFTSKSAAQGCGNYEQQTVALENGDVNVMDPNYPYEDIRDFLEGNQLLKDFFKGKQATTQIVNRQGLPGEDGENLCRVREYKVIYPQKLRNIYNIERTIVNIKNEYEQAIQVRTCYDSEGQCNKLKSVPLGQTSYCHQEFITRELMIYNVSRAFDEFKLPSCCVCKIRSV